MNDEKIEQLFKRSLFELPTQGYLEQGEPKLYAFDELEAIYATATDNPLRNYLKTMLTNTNYVGTQPGFMDQFNWQTDAGKRKLITFGHKKSDEHVSQNKEMQIAIQTMCKIAVFAAEPKAKFSIPKSHSQQMRVLVTDGIRMAIQEALDADPPKFEVGAEPVIDLDFEVKSNPTKYNP